MFRDAFNKIDEEHDYFKKIIVLNCIKKYASSLCSELESSQIAPTPEPGIPEPGIPEPGIPEPGIPEPGIPEPPEPGGEELTDDKIKEVCKDILSKQKLKLSDLKNEIRKKHGFEDESKWVSKLLELIRSGTILLTIDD